MGGSPAAVPAAVPADDLPPDFDALILPPVKGQWAHTLRQQVARRRAILIAESAPQVGGIYLGPRNLDGARALGDGLLDLDQRGDGALDRLLLDHQHFLYERLDDPERGVADVLDRDTFGDGVTAALHGKVVQPLVHRRVVLRFDSKDGNILAQRFGGDRHAGD